MIYLELFLSFLQVGLFSIGGGFAALPLIQEQVVDVKKWLTMTEFTDLITIAEMTPGPIAINSATFVGNRIAGVGGAIISTFGCILPSFIIVLTLAYFYFKYKNITIVKGILSGLRPAVVALIASAGFSIFILAIWGEHGFTWNVADVNFIALGLFLVSFIVLRKRKPNPIFIILGSGLVGMIIYLFIGV
ncbi:chromate transporter [Mobilitalea sibirica]|uniref:Chromate transporter n=1 Tax=Mobilitalea sibirica TaxID=1462919 RepID=A0A8J7HAX0_9FIRM|nr:chromate transporter [Mobilitalea sibirica]